MWVKCTAECGSKRDHEICEKKIAKGRRALVRLRITDGGDLMPGGLAVAYWPVTVAIL